MEELITIWNGEKDRYLCIPPLDVPVFRVKRQQLPEAQPADDTRIWNSHSADRIKVLKALAARETWNTKELAAVCQLHYRMLHAILHSERKKGTVRRVSHGVVALVTRQAA